MPPRLRSTKFSSPAATTPLPRRSSVRPQCISQTAQSSREFSQTSCQQITLRRRKFYAWLNGPGRQLKEPLPRSTNYLGAYDSQGNLVRAGPGWVRPETAKEQDDKTKKGASKEDKPAVADEETVKTEETLSEGETTLDELEAAIRSGEVEEKTNTSLERAAQDSNALPPETIEDLRPFPQNKYFRSQPVLSEDLREAIYQRVKRDGCTVSLASVEFGVSNERVGAVVRLKQMEKEWIAQGKTLAMPYSKAVLEMLPTTEYIDPSKPGNKNRRPIPHEPINDLIVHPATRQQLFVPVSESRHFTRVDAGKAFDNSLLPADARIPHPELVLAERDLAQGLSFEERRKLAQKRLAAEQEQKKKIEEKKAAAIRAQKVVPKRRWDFVFQDVSVDAVGRDGRGHKGVGWRYGIPHEDRKRGILKIPTKVDA